MVNEKKERFSLAQIPTETRTYIFDANEKEDENKYLTIEQALVKILNDIEKLKEGMLG